MDLFFIRLQDKSSTFAGPMDVVRQIIKKEGVLGTFLAVFHMYFLTSRKSELFTRIVRWYGVDILASLVVERGLLRMHLQSPQSPAQAGGMVQPFQVAYRVDHSPNSQIERD